MRKKGFLKGLGIGFSAAALVAATVALAQDDQKLSELMNCRVDASGTATLVDAQTGRPIHVSGRITHDKARGDCSVKSGGQIFSYKVI